MYDPSLIPAVIGMLKIALQVNQRLKFALIALTVRKDDTIGVLMHHVEGAGSKYCFLVVANWAKRSMS